MDGQHLHDQSVHNSWEDGSSDLFFSKDMPSSASRKRTGRCAGQRDTLGLES